MDVKKHAKIDENTSRGKLGGLGMGAWSLDRVHVKF